MSDAPRCQCGHHRLTHQYGETASVEPGSCTLTSCKCDSFVPHGATPAASAVEELLDREPPPNTTATADEVNGDFIPEILNSLGYYKSLATVQHEALRELIRMFDLRFTSEPFQLSGYFADHDEERKFTLPTPIHVVVDQIILDLNDNHASYVYADDRPDQCKPPDLRDTPF